jgi:hypothetical protein
MRDTIDMAREAGYMRTVFGGAEISMASIDCLKAFEALVRADEREETNRRANASWTLMCEKMVAAEREACAKVCEEHQFASIGLAAAIRARGTHDPM